MKKLFFYIATMLPAFAFAQTPSPAANDTLSFTVNGKAGNLNAPAKVYLQYFLGATNIIDSAAIVNGSFQFKGSLLNPTNANLAIDRKGLGVDKMGANPDVLNFYLEPGTITLNTTDSLAKANITGSIINDENTQLRAQLMVINAEAQKLKTDDASASPVIKRTPAYQSNLQLKFKALQEKQKNTLKNFITTHSNSYLSFAVLSSVSGPSPDYNEIEPLYNGLSQKLKNTETGKILKQQLDGLKNTAIGAAAPDFTQNDVNGKPVTLSSFKGKYVLLDFWASWCGPCIQENPNLVRNYNNYKNRNFTIIGISLDKIDSKNAWLTAIKNEALDWTQVSDLKFWSNDVALLYSVQSIPQNFLIDPTGKIIAKNLRGADLDAKMEELFGKIKFSLTQ